MRVRAIDNDHDFLYGKGQNDYRTANAAIAQNIDTRLSSFLGDCFFDLGAGIDWFNLLGGKDEIAINLAISAVILNTDGVTGMIQTSISLNSNRLLSVAYKVQTVYSTVSSIFQYDLNGIG